MVPFINSDQMQQEEKMIGKCLQLTIRNVKHFFFKFLDGHRLIFSCYLNVFGIITVFNLFQDCFS